MNTPATKRVRWGAWLAFALGFGLFVTAAAASRASALWSLEHMLRVHGQPRFILGLYENPPDDAVLQEAVAAGFNLVQSAPDAAALDRLQRFGVQAWVNVGGSLDLSQDTAARREQLVALVRQCSDHPALLVWEGPDEILWNHWWGTLELIRPELQRMRDAARGQPALETLSQRAREEFDRGLYAQFEETRARFWSELGQPSAQAGVRLDEVVARLRRTGEGVAAGIRVLREADAGRHVIWLNHAPRNSLADLGQYNAEADMAGCDIYPAPANLTVGHSDLVDLRLTSVGAYTERMRQAAPGKVCAMVLQGFGWRDLRQSINEHEMAVGIGRRPTWAESRFMAYEAILHGANAVLYWGTAYLKPVEDDGSAVAGRPRLWRDVLKVARELRALEPALVARPLKSPRVRQAPTYGSIDGRGVICTLRRVADDYVLIVGNEAAEGLAYTLEALPAALNGRTVYRLYAEEQHVIAGRRFADGLRAFDVHVYATTRRFEDPSIRMR